MAGKKRMADEAFLPPPTDTYEQAAAFLRTAATRPPAQDTLLSESIREQDALPHGTTADLNGGAASALAAVTAEDLRRFPGRVITSPGKSARCVAMQLGAIKLLVDLVPRKTVLRTTSRRMGRRSQEATTTSASTEGAATADPRATVLCAPCGTGKSLTSILAATHILLTQLPEFLASLPQWAANKVGSMGDVRAGVLEGVPTDSALFVVPAHLADQWERNIALQVLHVLRTHYARPDLKVHRGKLASGLCVFTYEEFERLVAEQPERAYPVVVFDEVAEEAAFRCRQPLVWRAICVCAGAATLNNALAAAPEGALFKRMLRSGRDEQESLAGLITRDVLRGLRHLVAESAAPRMPSAVERHTVSVQLLANGAALGAMPPLASLDAMSEGAAAHLVRLLGAEAGSDTASRAQAAVQELREATHNCNICYEDVREAWFNQCCHSSCMRCRDNMTGVGQPLCHMCRQPVGQGVHVSARLRAGDLATQLAEVGAARHAHITNALAEVLTALVAEGRCRRIVVFGPDLSKWDSVLTLHDLMGRLRPRVEVMAPQDANRASYAGQEDVPAFLVTEDPTRKALVLGGGDARALAGLDLTGTDALVLVGRTVGIAEMTSRVLRMGVCPAAQLRVVKLSVA
jgi:hypothetical protein